MIHEKRKWTKGEMYYFLALHNSYSFTMLHWKDELTIPSNRTDLPKEWRGSHVITREQRLMMLDRAQKVQFCTGRKIAKTITMEARYYQWPLLNLLKGSSTEGMFYTPREHHRDQFLSRIKSKALRLPLFNLLKDQFNEGRQEFTFKTGFTWFNRIEGNSANAGKNMVGPRCAKMMGDEGAYGNDDAYAERLNTALPYAEWMWGGVPNGIRGSKFHSISETSDGSAWSRHRWDMRACPLYHSKRAWDELVQDHGGSNTQSFITQVLGQWGEATVASFPILPQVANTPYTRIELTGDKIAATHDLATLLNLRVPDAAGDFILGGDLGFSPSPTILTIMHERDGVWREMATVEMLLANTVQQAQVMNTICLHALPRRPIRGCLDAHAGGSGVLDNLYHNTAFDNAYYKQAFIDAGFAGSLQDPNVMVHKQCNFRVRQAVDGSWYCDGCRKIIYDVDVKPALVPTKQFLTIDLKEALLNGQSYLDASTVGATG